MNVSDSLRAAQIRRDTWRRRHDRRMASSANGSATTVKLPVQIAGLLVRLSHGRISARAAQDMVARGDGETRLEIVIDVETGSVEGWSMRTRFPSRGGGGSDAPAIVDPAA